MKLWELYWFKFRGILNTVGMNKVKRTTIIKVLTSVYKREGEAARSDCMASHLYRLPFIFWERNVEPMSSQNDGTLNKLLRDTASYDKQSRHVIKSNILICPFSSLSTKGIFTRPIWSVTLVLWACAMRHLEHVLLFFLESAQTLTLLLK